MEWIRRFTCTLIFVVGIVAPRAQGQTQEPPKKLPEVLVVGEALKTNYVVDDATTATDTDTPISEIPQSIEVIDRDVIDDQRIERLQDAVYNVSGVQPGDSVIIPFRIRGFRAEILKDGFAASTSIFLNKLAEETANIDRIEFLKGPGSVVYGNVAAGGIINIISKKPLPYFFASAEGTAGSFSFYKGAVDMSTPLNKDKTILFRINASYVNSESFRDFIFSDRALIAPVLTWQITPNMLLTLEGEYYYVDEPIDFGIVAIGDTVAGIPFSRNLGEPTDRSHYKSYLARATLETKLSENVFLRNSFRYYRIYVDRDDHDNLVLLPDNSTLERFVFDSTLEQDLYTFRNELIANVKTWELYHTLLFGFEYIRDNTDNPAKFRPASPIDIFDPVYGIPDPSVDVPLIARNVDINDFGFYVQDQMNLFDKLYFLAGLRFDFVDQHIEDIGIGDFTTDESFGEFAPRLGLVYEPFPGISLFANYSRAFNSLLVRSFSFDDTILEPEITNQFEGGIKAFLFNGRISSTVSLYRIIKDNALEPDPINGIAFSVQVEKERSQGIEFDFTAQPFPGWNIIASYAFIDAEILEDDEFPEGNRLPAVPKNSGSFWTTYRFQNGILEGFGLGAGLIAVGDRQGDLENTFTIGSFVRFDGALYYEKAIRNLALIKASVNFKNITDERYIATSATRVNIIPGEPFTVLASLKVEF